MTVLLKNRSSKKGVITSTTAFFVTAVIIIILLAYWMQQSSHIVAPINPPVACSQEAKLCSDGSAVGRTGPNCEFAQCPQQNIDTSDWKTYRNEKYGFEVKYPNNWSVKETVSGVELINPTGHYISVDQESLDSAFNFTCVKEKCDHFLKTESGLTAVVQYGMSGNIDAEIKKANDIFIDFYKECPGYKEDNIVASCTGTIEDRNIFEQLVSTFKFTK